MRILPKWMLTALMLLPAALLWTGCDGLRDGGNANSAPSQAPSLALIKDGQPRAVILAPADRASLRMNGVDAVEELVEHLRLISGATLPVVTNAADLPAGRVPIRLGTMADAALEEVIRPRGEVPSAFALRVRPDGVDIRGFGDTGTLFGVYALLEQLGVRWYAPGEWGRVVPEARTVRLALQETVQAPSCKIRRLGGWMSSNTGWWIRQRQGTDIERAKGRHGMPGNPPSGTSRQVCLSLGPSCPRRPGGGGRSLAQIAGGKPRSKKFRHGTAGWRGLLPV